MYKIALSKSFNVPHESLQSQIYSAVHITLISICHIVGPDSCINSFSYHHAKRGAMSITFKGRKAESPAYGHTHSKGSREIYSWGFMTREPLILTTTYAFATVGSLWRGREMTNSPAVHTLDLRYEAVDVIFFHLNHWAIICFFCLLAISTWIPRTYSQKA